MAQDFDLQIKIAADIASAVENMKTLSGAISEIAKAAKQGLAPMGEIFRGMGDELEKFGKKTNKFGKDLVRDITLPLTALAGLSLKKIFDEAISGRGTANMQAFAGAIQQLKKNFESLLIDIGDRIAPVVTGAINIINSLIEKWKSLDGSTKNIILTIAGVAAAIGPLIVAFGTVLVIIGKFSVVWGNLLIGFSKIAPLIQTIGGLFTAVNVAIVGTIAIIAGLINVFIKLKSAGMDTFEAVGETINWFAAQFGSVVGGNILKVIAKLTQGLGVLASYVNEDFGNSIKSAGDFINQLAKDSDDYAKQASKSINEKLAKVGTSAAEAFTFGLFGGVEKETAKNPVKFKLSPDVQQMIIETKAALQQAALIVSQNNVELQKLQSDHQSKMNAIIAGENNLDNINTKIEADKQYLAKKQELQKQELDAEFQKSIALAKTLEDRKSRELAIAAATNKYKVDLAKLTTEQEKQDLELALQAEEQILQRKKEVFDKYAQPFASRLSGAFIDFASGAKTAGEAFEEFARNFLRRIGQMILEQQILNMLGGFLGSSSGKTTTSGGGRVGQIPIPGNANGGLITGAGTGTSDSILSWLSNGEFVMTAAAVSKYGSNFFDNLNAAARGGRSVTSKLGRYADGGMVQSSAQAPQVVIQNSGSPKDVVDTSFDPASAVTTVILQDVQKNGPISKSLQSTYGMRRGSFR